MTRRMMSVGIALCLVAGLQQASIAQQSAPGRALTIEDYYHVQMVTGPQISPDGRWVLFSVGTRIEQDNSTRNEVLVVPADASAAPRRVLHYGKDVTDPSWTADGRLQYTADRQKWSSDPANARTAPVRLADMPAGAIASADGKWVAFARDKAQPKKEATYASEFEKRHEERFKGVTFDWKDFQRDGQPFPAPNLRARPAAELVIQPADRRRRQKALTDADIRPANIAWHPERHRCSHSPPTPTGATN